MAADVIINPTSGEIYWNDGAGTTQSISIRGDSQNKIDFIGYSSGFSPGSSGIGTFTIATFNDNSGTSAFVPGTSGYDLGSSVLRWNTFATNANLSGVLLVGDATNTTSLITGAVKLNGGIAISSNASIGQTLLFFNSANYTGFRSGATGNTVYTFPATSPATGSSVLSSTSAGVMSWVPLTASSSSSGGTVASGTQYQIAGYYAGTGASVAGSSTFTNDTAIGTVKISHTTSSFGTSVGALQVAGGVGISGQLTFNQASFGTTGISSLPTMAMIGQTGDPIYLSILEDNSLSFEGSQGQLFSISPNLTTGYIWAVNDISGVPLLRASVGGTVYISEFGGLLGIGQTNPTYKLDLKGSFGLASSNDAAYNFIFSNSAASGSNSLQIRSANSLLLYNSGNTFYTGLKSNASANVTYTLPATDGSADQFLKTNGTGTLSWGTPSGGSGGGGTGVGAGGQYEVAVYPATGSSVVGYSSLKNDVSANVVSVSHSTVATNHTNGAFTVSGGVGIGGSLYVAGIGASITGVTFSNSTITRGTWNGTVISTTYGGTGQNLGSSTGILTISSGTVSASTTSSAIASALSDETGSGSLVFNSSPSFGTGVTTNSATFAVFNTNATTINAFGAATAINIGASTGKATFNSTDNSTSSTTGGIVVSGGAGFAKSVSIAGRLQLLNGANVTAFVSSGSGNTLYILPASTPATGSSVLQSDSIGNLSWVPMVASSSAGSGTVAVPGAQYQIAAYYSGTGASVSGSTTFTNNTATSQVAITHNTASTSTSTGALVVTGGVGIGGSLYTSTGSSSSVSGVILANGNVSATTYNKLTLTAPATSATLTLANGSSLITSGANSLTLTTTTASNVTFPNSGTLTTTGNNLSVFASTTSAQLATLISDETGSGNLVFNSQPSFGTGVTTGNATFAVFNTNATTINAFGAATVISIGAATGKATFNSTDNSTSTTTGGLVVSGGAGFAKSITVGGRLQMINGANYTAFVSSATSDVVYTLPPAAPSGTGTSYLSASTTGVMAWVAAPTGGSATPGGSNKQIQYNNSSSFGGAAGFEYTTGGIAITVGMFANSGTGYTAGLWVHSINGTTTRVGIGLSNPAYELEILGEISATNKSFVIDHPTKEGMKLRYGSLEGPENGVYVRGELKGTNIIEVPDHWVGLVHEDSYTVHLTPIGRFSQLYVEKIENYNVFVADTMMCPIHCYYSVWAERKDIPKLVTEYEAQ